MLLVLACILLLLALGFYAQRKRRADYVNRIGIRLRNIVQNRL